MQENIGIKIDYVSKKRWSAATAVRDRLILKFKYTALPVFAAQLVIKVTCVGNGSVVSERFLPTRREDPERNLG